MICDPIIGSSVAQDLYVLLTLTEVDAVRPEMVDEVLQDVHHVGGDVVEGDGVVAAAGESLLVRVVLVGRVPVGEVTRDQVMLRDKREESLLAPGVPRVSGLHSELLHALPHLDILRPPAVLPTIIWIIGAIHGKSPKSLLGENISCSATEVALICERFELPTEEHWHVGFEVLEEISEVIHYHVCVIVRLEEPVIFLIVVFVDVLEGVLSLVPEVSVTFSDVELDCWQVGVLL